MCYVWLMSRSADKLQMLFIFIALYSALCHVLNGSLIDFDSSETEKTPLDIRTVEYGARAQGHLQQVPIISFVRSRSFH